MAELMECAVAVSFIFQFPDGDEERDPRVALFRRSGQVNTYQHKLAPISGGVEVTDENPLATAWRELREETTLTSDSLKLFRQGKPYSFADPDVGRRWTINPFAFILKPTEEGGKGEKGITIDWEHEGYEWFNPDEVTDDESFQGVPRLKESLRRVWFDIDLGKKAGRALAAALRSLQNDHQSGAGLLAVAAYYHLYEDVIPKLDTSDRDKWWRNVRFAAWHLWKNGRESMGAPILNGMLSILDTIDQRLNSSIQGAPTKDDVVRLCDTISAIRLQRDKTGIEIAKAFSHFLHTRFRPASNDGGPVKILTLSFSSTITNTLARGLSSPPLYVPLDIRVLESRPLFEGVKLARLISTILQGNPDVNATTKLSVYTDASVALASKGAQILLLGADLLDKSGNVCNKIGSLPAVLTAKHVSPDVKVIVLTEKSKIYPFDPPPCEENDAEEVVGAWKRDVLGITSIGEMKRTASVPNVYFEWVPASMVDVYLTEDGPLSREQLLELATGVEEKASRYFDTL
ncbi:nagb/rpia/CoA transferase-like protein [Trichoderma citrinoviride]|uniref:Nagb/rpia/CoA transferase-like protein n=1 Tax=Trichoderma citrinoviride TaxID=58853 RepID=A0A2T4B893_9HYPO|nr:nagb/rpia/CoA transferase-like protein [Trichoderma citrinoviride]PTB65546.1 nagb/rpia/CoA transferase-like protein [Trichoderma citrinoviride]